MAGREERRRFWAAIAAGTASEDAAVGVGVPQAVGTRWFRKAGGMPPSMFGLTAKPLCGRYLSFAEREEIALLRVQGYSMQEVARRLRASGIDNLQRAAAQRPAHPKAAASRIVRRQRNGTPSALLAAQSRREACAQRGVREPMSRNGWLASLWLRAGLLFPARSCPGKAVGTDHGRTGDGQTPGARSRSPVACRWTSRTTRPCASAMKPSIKALFVQGRGALRAAN